jgi:hypothetical protein
MKKIRDKTIGVIIHIYIWKYHKETPCVYLYVKQAKMSCFSFYLFSFSTYNIGEQEGGTSPAQEGGLAPVGGGRCWVKGGRRVNTMQKMCTHVCNCNNSTC